MLWLCALCKNSEENLWSCYLEAKVPKQNKKPRARLWDEWKNWGTPIRKRELLPCHWRCESSPKTGKMRPDGLLAFATLSLPSLSFCGHVELWAAPYEPCKFQHCLHLSCLHVLILRDTKHPELFLKPLSTMGIVHPGPQGHRKWQFTLESLSHAPRQPQSGRWQRPSSVSESHCPWPVYTQRQEGPQKWELIGFITNLPSITSCWPVAMILDHYHFSVVLETVI